MVDAIRRYVEAVESGVPGFDTAEDREKVARWKDAMARMDRALAEVDAAVSATLAAIQDPLERTRVGMQMLGKNYVNHRAWPKADG
jgi:uncharacterized protein YicC (UPF0701 family)